MRLCLFALLIWVCLPNAFATGLKAICIEQSLQAELKLEGPSSLGFESMNVLQLQELLQSADVKIKMRAENEIYARVKRLVIMSFGPKGRGRDSFVGQILPEDIVQETAIRMLKLLGAKKIKNQSHFEARTRLYARALKRIALAKEFGSKKFPHPPKVSLENALSGVHRIPLEEDPERSLEGLEEVLKILTEEERNLLTMVILRNMNYEEAAAENSRIIYKKIKKGKVIRNSKRIFGYEPDQVVYVPGTGQKGTVSKILKAARSKIQTYLEEHPEFDPEI